MARVSRRNANSEKSSGIKMKFDVLTLNLLLKYIRCEYVGSAQLSNLHKLISSLALTDYAYQVDVYVRLRTLSELLKLMVESKVFQPELLYTELMSIYPDASEVIPDVETLSKTELSSAECDYLTERIREKSTAAIILKKKGELISKLEELDNPSLSTSYYQLTEDIKTTMSNIVAEIQALNMEDNGLMEMFSFSDRDSASLIDKWVQKKKKPSAILQTGIRQLNLNLNPGLLNAESYLIVGGTGKFKSGFMLNLADQVRKYNPQINPIINGRRATILFFTLENSIELSLERIYDMYSGLDDELRDKTTEEVLSTYRNEGKFEFTDTSGIDITFIYRGFLELSTADIPGIIEKVRESGKEPICIFVDYLKRINSAQPWHGDERVRINMASKELGNIAKKYQVPLVTAMQLNRDGNGIIDAAMRDNKADVARFVGASNIANAWDVVEDSFWVCLINLERAKSTNQLFLTIKVLKRRGKRGRGNVQDYFNHPFVNDKCIRLETDVDKPESVSRISLASDLESIDEESDESDDEHNINKRKRMSAVKAYTDSKSSRIFNTLKAIEMNNLIQ